MDGQMMDQNVTENTNHQRDNSQGWVLLGGGINTLNLEGNVSTMTVILVVTIGICTNTVGCSFIKNIIVFF